LNRELFLHIDELRYVGDRWRMDYNHYCPHSSLDYMAPAAFATKCLEQGSATLYLTQDKVICVIYFHDNWYKKREQDRLNYVL
jgi:hypothetical protein